MCIVEVTEETIALAGEIHSQSWKKSHEAFCSLEFVEKHTPERQTDYLRKKMNNGSRIFMMFVESVPVAIISITESLIEDLYVHPNFQKSGYGTKLLDFSLTKCTSTPVLWILENNIIAEKFYSKKGFSFTGNSNSISSGLRELEMTLCQRDVRPHGNGEGQLE